MKINLSDTTTLEALFNEVDSWGNLPTSSLSPQQIALLNLKHTARFYHKEQNNCKYFFGWARGNK